MSSTAAIIVSAVIAFAVTAGLGFIIIPWLRKLKFGQTILEIGPSWHKAKQGTPNMGGLMFIIGIVAAFVISVLLLLQTAEIRKPIILPFWQEERIYLLFQALFLLLDAAWSALQMIILKSEKKK